MPLRQKKHFNAADRKDLQHLYRALPHCGERGYRVEPGLHVRIEITFGLIIGIIGLIARARSCAGVLQYSRTAEQHRMVPTKYLRIANECSRMKAYYQDGACPQMNSRAAR